MLEEDILYKLVKMIDQKKSCLDELENNQLKFTSQNEDASTIKDKLNINGIVYTTSTHKIHGQLSTVDQFHVYNSKLFIDSLRKKAAKLFKKNNNKKAEIDSILTNIVKETCGRLSSILSIFIELPVKAPFPSPVLNIIAEYTTSFSMSAIDSTVALLGVLDEFIKLNCMINDEISTTADSLKTLLCSAEGTDVVKTKALAKTLNTHHSLEKRNPEKYALTFFLNDAVQLSESRLSEFKLSM